jgi:hypothetical protein
MTKMDTGHLTAIGGIRHWTFDMGASQFLGDELSDAQTSASH